MLPIYMLFVSSALIKVVKPLELLLKLPERVLRADGFGSDKRMLTPSRIVYWFIEFPNTGILLRAEEDMVIVRLYLRDPA